MSDFGARLREARERRAIALKEISEHAKISITALEALERSDVSRLPGGIFARSFVRSYAAEIGLDPDKTVRPPLPHHPGAAKTSAIAVSS
jgi:cytoskeletal protein RodZ